MQDILTESGLSTGAVYRYFRSKDEIITAVVTEAAAELAASLNDALDTARPLPPAEAMGRMLAVQQRLAADEDLAKLAVLIWGEAIRSPDLGACMAAAHESWRSILLSLIEEYQEAGVIARSVPADHIALTLTGFLLGFVVQYAVMGPTDAETFTAGLSAILPQKLGRIQPPGHLILACHFQETGNERYVIHIWQLYWRITCSVHTHQKRWRRNTERGMIPSQNTRMMLLWRIWSRSRPAGIRARWRCARRDGGRKSFPAGPGAGEAQRPHRRRGPGVRAVHLGLDRRAEGGGGAASCDCGW